MPSPVVRVLNLRRTDQATPLVFWVYFGTSLMDELFGPFLANSKSSSLSSDWILLRVNERVDGIQNVVSALNNVAVPPGIRVN